MDFIRAFQSLPRKAEADLEGAILEGEILHRREPNSAGVLAELAKLYRRAGRDDDAIGAGARAITVAIHGGMSPVAVEVYRSFLAQRDRFELSATTFDGLARVLRAQGYHEDAQWCAERAAALS
jgi:hypothetical protein